MLFRSAFLALALPLLPVTANAHPHVFIDAALALIYDDQGRLTAVEVEWAYDDLYSLLIIEDHELDPDGDGHLAPAEMDILQGFDADWEPGFDGRLYLGVEGRRIALDGPEGFQARYEDGRIVSRHLRPLSQPLAGEMPLLVQVYDPEYYVDFSLPDAPRIVGREDCEVAQRHGDSYAAAEAYARAVEAALAGDDSALGDEMVVVDIGAAGAAELRLSCGAGR